MIKLRNLKAEVTTYKRIFMWVGVTGVALAGFILACNFAFNPASSVHFTVYVPQQKSMYSSHLVIPGYEDSFFTIFGIQQAVLGYAIVGENTKVIQEKSTSEVNCDGLEKCATKWTKKGQLYKHGYKKYNESDSFEQVALLKKGDTKITIRKSSKETLSSEELDRFIDMLEAGSISRPYIYGEHKWQLV